MIKLTENQIDILGKPNFACARWAKLLIAGKVYEDKAKKAEYEQAVFIHWASALYDLHGDNWMEAGNKIMRGVAQKLIDDREERDADCCCGETEESWRLCPKHQDIKL